MKNEKSNKDKKNTKAITIRIDQETLSKYDETLTAVYGKNHRKKSTSIETLLNQFNNQNTKQLKQYLEQDIPIINLCNETIDEYQAQLQEKNNETQSLKNIIDEKAKHIETLESSQKENKEILNDKHHQEMQAIETKYTDEIQSLKNTIQDKEQTIKDKDSTIETLSKEIDRLTDELNQASKDIRSARNDYKHSSENLNKLHLEYNALQNKNENYAVAIAELKKMSFLEKLFNKYPDSVKELSDGKDSS